MNSSYLPFGKQNSRIKTMLFFLNRKRRKTCDDRVDRIKYLRCSMLMLRFIYKTNPLNVSDLDVVLFDSKFIFDFQFSFFLLLLNAFRSEQIVFILVSVFYEFFDGEFCFDLDDCLAIPFLFCFMEHLQKKKRDFQINYDFRILFSSNFWSIIQTNIIKNKSM